MRSPVTPRYGYRERRYPWAERNIAAAEAIHGPPEPTCYCGAPLGIPLHGGRVPRCTECGRSAAGNYGGYAGRSGPEPAPPAALVPRCHDCGFVTSATTAALLSIQQCTCDTEAVSA